MSESYHLFIYFSRTCPLLCYSQVHRGEFADARPASDVPFSLDEWTTFDLAKKIMEMNG